ncbi:cytosolic carboxypeptidase 4 isoform X1 [Stegostoma tigrinum]|uniref:cytosolic carboxypeptidase 4 isoform X1 n=1 Tax=Stegostoma tigrinum TaxID=3053191 RepID=UPI00286FFCE7|nr:cytosolic carboxypeptidase 4 isoform X1 [Stegostoma tigrinum]
MTSASGNATGLEILLSTLKSSHDVQNTLSILQILDELLSAGTVKRIRYMISKGGSEALLHTLINMSRIFPPNYDVLLPLMHLIIKVGQRDKRFGQKAQEIGAINETLNLLKHSLPQPKYVTPCLWVLKIYASSVVTGATLGKSGITRLLFKLISPYTTRNTKAVRAAIEALSALLKSKWNCRKAVDNGYVHKLLKVYQDWHQRDTQNKFIPIHKALLNCIKNITNIQIGKEAFLQANGMRILLRASQAYGTSAGLQPVVKLATQVMRRCHPKQPLPLLTARSCYSFVLPNAADSHPLDLPNTVPQEVIAMKDDDEDQDDEDDIGNEEPACNEDDDDLETDLTRLRPNPQLDRPVEELKQYERLCPELIGYFQNLDTTSEEQNRDGVNVSGSAFFATSPSQRHKNPKQWQKGIIAEALPALHSSIGYRRTHQISSGSSDSREESDSKWLTEHSLIQDSSRIPVGPSGGCTLNPSKHKIEKMHQCMQRPSVNSSKTCIQNVIGEDRSHLFSQSRSIDSKQNGQDTGCKLLEMRREIVPFHDPYVYTTMAEKTKSASDYKTLAFPDYWGHISPLYQEPLTGQWSGHQRDKIFEDIQRLVSPGDTLNKVVFDVESLPLVTSEDDNSLKFYSNFESGNLRKAIQICKYEYDLIMNADINTDLQHQWFYFKLSGMKAGIPYRFNIINCEKTNSQFNYGMQPVMYSVHEALCGRPHWVRAGSDIYYYKNHYCRYSAAARGQKETSFYTLTFTVTFLHLKDVCYLAYHYPYTYSTLMTHLHLLEESLNPDQVYFRHQTLCSTLGGNRCPVITITAGPGSQREELHQFWNRHYVVLTARVHPGESNASWVMKGTLEFLVSNDPIARSLRDSYIFKIIPMLNPDGVINGCHRCSLSGEDLNRQWSEPKPDLHPTIYHTKGLLNYMRSIGKTPLVYCDYHGHSRKKNVFMYGCSIKETLWQARSSVDTATLKEDIGYRTIPRVLDKISPAFAMNRCCFLVQKSREATARVVVWREIGVLRSYTMESTYCGCDQGKYNGLQLGTRELEEIGAKFCTGLLKLKKEEWACSKQLITEDDAVLDFDNELQNDRHMRHSDGSVDDEPPCPEEIDYDTDSCTEEDDDSIDLAAELDLSSGDELELDKK